MFKIFDETREYYRIGEAYISDIFGRNYCVFDIEGTGLDYTEDQVTQIGAIKIVKGEIVDIPFSEYVHPQKAIPNSIEKFTGITNQMVENAPEFDAVYKRFEQYASGCILVAQCGYEYDYWMLNEMCKKYGMRRKEMPELDTKILFKAIHPDVQTKISTDYLVIYYEVMTEDVMRHNALGNSIIIARVLQGILRECKAMDIFCLSIEKSMKILKYIPQILT
jgi:DNA polymerase-3 subunit epsilon